MEKVTKPPTQVIGVESVDSGFATGGWNDKEEKPAVKQPTNKGGIPRIRCPFCHKDVRSIISASHQKACRSKFKVKCEQCGERVLYVNIANGSHGERCIKNG